MGTRNEGRTDRQGDGHDIKQKNLNYNRVRERERERERERNEEGCNLRIGKLIPYGEEEEGGGLGGEKDGKDKMRDILGGSFFEAKQKLDSRL